MPDNPEPSTPINPERISDPTPLTTQALLREVGHVRIELASEVKNIDTRFDAMDKAVALVKDNLNQVPTELQSQITCLRDVIDEKFNGVTTRFNLNDLALTAALAAAKEAVSKAGESSNLAAAKAEAATTKQMDQVRDIVNTSIGGLNDKIDIHGNRMTTLEQQMSGLLQTVAQLRAMPSAQLPQQQTPIGLWIMAGFGVVILLIILAFEIAQRAPAGVVR